MQCCACAAGPQQNENIVQNLAQNRRKTCPEAPGSRQEHQRSKQTFFLQFFGVPRPKPHYDFDPFWLQNCRKVASKKQPKIQAPPKPIFSRFFRFCASPGHDFNGFLGPKMASRRAVTSTFAGPFYSRIFAAFFGNKSKNVKSAVYTAHGDEFKGSPCCKKQKHS